MPETSFCDGVGCHMQNMEVSFLFGGAWCQEHFLYFRSKKVWPPLSPDLKAMDCCVQSLLEADACASLHWFIEAQKCSLMTVWAEMPQETLREVAEGFCSRLKCVIQAKEGILNEILYECLKMSC